MFNFSIQRPSKMSFSPIFFCSPARWLPLAEKNTLFGTFIFGQLSTLPLLPVSACFPFCNHPDVRPFGLKRVYGFNPFSGCPRLIISSFGQCQIIRTPLSNDFFPFHPPSHFDLEQNTFSLLNGTSIRMRSLFTHRYPLLLLDCVICAFFEQDI